MRILASSGPSAQRSFGRGGVRDCGTCCLRRPLSAPPTEVVEVIDFRTVARWTLHAAGVPGRVLHGRGTTVRTEWRSASDLPPIQRSIVVVS
jgi:hypothetical protein